MKLELIPCTIGDASAFVKQHHRHHPPPVSGLFAAAVGQGEHVRAVAMAGRPVARELQDGFTAEVTRVAVDAAWKDAADTGWAGGLWTRAKELGLRGLAHAQWVLERMARAPSGSACSMLYGALWRAAAALGYRKMITYTLAEEAGGSVRAAGWRVVAEVKGRSWSCPSRPRVDKHPTQGKLRWEAP